MISHTDLWRALDALAAERGLSASALARAAGLDPTSFNPSKRQAADGRRRWPGTESLLRALGALDVSLEQFALVAQRCVHIDVTIEQTPAAGIPVVAWSSWGQVPFGADGLPACHDWQRWPSPVAAGRGAYGIVVDHDGLSPLVPRAAVVVVSPMAAVRPGDRVVVWGGGIIGPLAILAQLSAQHVCLAPVAEGCPVPQEPLPRPTIFLHRIAAICV